MSLTREAIINRLDALPHEILHHERELLAVQDSISNARAALDRPEGELLQSGEIDGKNEALRKAQMAELTKEEREGLRQCEFQLGLARIALSYAQNSFAAARALARLFAGSDL